MSEAIALYKKKQHRKFSSVGDISVYIHIPFIEPKVILYYKGKQIQQTHETIASFIGRNKTRVSTKRTHIKISNRKTVRVLWNSSSKKALTLWMANE